MAADDNETTARKLPVPSPGVQVAENAKIAILAALQLIPYGGAIATVLAERLPQWRRKHLEKFVELLGEDIASLSDRVNAGAIQNEEFGLLLEDVLTKVSRTTGEEKLASYRAILLNEMTVPSGNQATRDMYLSMIDNLTDFHLLVLSLFFDQPGFASRCGVSVAKQASGYSVMTTVCHYLSSSYGKELISQAILDLEARGLLTRDVHKHLESGIASHTDLRGRVSGMGVALCKYITRPVKAG